jgi:ketosteroid isomerase-like protein
MHGLLMALGLAAAVPGSSAGPDSTAVMAVVHQFVNAFNKGDARTAAAACADETSIIDEFPPYEWHGANGCGQWMDAFAADAEKNGITDGRVTLAAPRHVDLAGDRAYVVVPANYAFKNKGKPTRETGSILTIALQKVGAGWRITGWAWAKH